MIILASKSVARTAILTGAGIGFEAVGSGVDEDVTKARLLAGGAGSRAIAQALAAEKAVAVSSERSGLVIGADQTLELEGRLYDKVADLAAARDRLELLRGKTHLLHSAVVVAEAGRVIWSETVSPVLTMRAVSDAFLEDYLAVEGQAALGSVGCYRLEGPGIQLFAEIVGDYFSILGLPLLPLLAFLRTQKAVAA